MNVPVRPGASGGRPARPSDLSPRIRAPRACPRHWAHCNFTEPTVDKGVERGREGTYRHSYLPTTTHSHLPSVETVWHPDARQATGDVACRFVPPPYSYSVGRIHVCAVCDGTLYLCRLCWHILKCAACCEFLPGMFFRRMWSHCRDAEMVPFLRRFL